MLLSKSRSLWTVIALTLLVAGWTSSARAGNGFFRNGGVGGVAIDTEGVVSQPTADATTALREAMIERLGQVPHGLEQPTRLRRISLRQLNEAIDDAWFRVWFGFGLEFDFWNWSWDVCRIESWGCRAGF